MKIKFPSVPVEAATSLSSGLRGTVTVAKVKLAGGSFNSKRLKTILGGVPGHMLLNSPMIFYRVDSTYDEHGTMTAVLAYNTSFAAVVPVLYLPKVPVNGDSYGLCRLLPNLESAAWEDRIPGIEKLPKDIQKTLASVPPIKKSDLRKGGSGIKLLCGIGGILRKLGEDYAHIEFRVPETSPFMEKLLEILPSAWESSGRLWS